MENNLISCSFCNNTFQDYNDYLIHGFEMCISCGQQFKHFYPNPFFSKGHYFGFIRCFDENDSQLIEELFKRAPGFKDMHWEYFTKKDIFNSGPSYKKIIDLYGYYEGYLLSKILLPDGFLCEACLKEFEWKKDIVHLVSALSQPKTN